MKVHAIGSVAAREPPWLCAVKRPIVDVDIEYLIGRDCTAETVNGAMDGIESKL